MAEPKPAEPRPASRPADPAAAANPKLVAVPEEKAPSTPPRTEPAPPERSGGVSWPVFGLVALLLVFAVAGLVALGQRSQAQAERITGLRGQVEGLESQLALATAQLASYDVTLSRVRSQVDDIVDRMGSLHALVQADPLVSGAAQDPPDAGAAPAPERSPSGELAFPPADLE